MRRASRWHPGSGSLLLWAALHALAALTEGTCVDRARALDCEAYSMTGQCNGVNADAVRALCPFSCGACPTTAAPTEDMAVPTPAFAQGACVDGSGDCQVYSLTGQCNGAAATAVRALCPFSCGACPMTAVRTALPTAVPTASPTPVPITYRVGVLASNGLASATEKWGATFEDHLSSVLMAHHGLRFKLVPLEDSDLVSQTRCAPDTFGHLHIRHLHIRHLYIGTADGMSIVPA